MYLSFPVVATGDIEGTVYLQDETGQRKPFKGALVNLYKDGTLVNNKVSEFDGYYSFPEIALGKYEIRLDPAQAAELDLQQQKEIVVTLEEIEQFEVRDMLLVKSAPKTVKKEPVKRKKRSKKSARRKKGKARR